MSGKVGFILGSTRPAGNGRHISRWIRDLIDAETGRQYVDIKLGEWNLPLFDEPGMPARDPPVHAHTKAWQERIASLDGFLILTPQYNWGYPAALKNALDYLFKEWNDKPVAVITYGGRGGGKCADQLSQVLHGLRMRVVEQKPGLKLEAEHITHGLTQEQANTAFLGYKDEILDTVRTLEAMLQERET